MSSQSNKMKKNGKPKRTELQKAGAAFVDHLGKAAVEKLKVRLGLNTETKYVDFYNASTTTTALAVVGNTFSTPIPQGLTDNTREGASVRITRQRFSGVVTNGAANASAFTCARVLIVRWKPTAGGNVSSNTTDVLEFVNPGLETYLSFATDHPVYENHIVFDRSFVLGATNNGADPNLYNWSFDYSPNDFHGIFTTADTAGTLANSIGDVLTVLIVATAATAANFPSVQYQQRVEYVDN